MHNVRDQLGIASISSGESLFGMSHHKLDGAVFGRGLELHLKIKYWEKVGEVCD